MTIRNAIALLFAASFAAADPGASFAPPQNYPNIGFTFPIFDHAKADPVPMPLAHTYVLVGEDGLTREDRFDPFELWYADQCCARWSDPQGNRLVLGRLTRQLPAFDTDFVSRENFADELNDDANRVDPKKQNDVNDWVATFVDFSVYKPERVKVNTFNLDDVFVYPCDAANTVVYAFRPRRIGNAKNFDWFCAIFRSADTPDPKTLRAFVEDRFLGRIETPRRGATDEGSEAGELNLHEREESHADYPGQSVRAAARKSIENYDSWWSAETEDYMILSDAGTVLGKTLIRNLKAQLPALHKACVRLLPPLAHDRDVSLVRVFQTRDDYVRYVGADQAWTAGVWMPGRRELVLSVGDSLEDLMRVIRHEAFHQYLSYAYCMIPAPPWLNEGHACLFENATVDGKGKVTIEEDTTRSALLLDNIAVATAFLPKLLEADYSGFYSGSAIERNFKYAIAWGLAYYLQKGAPQERNTPFTDILPVFAEALAQTQSYEQATRQAFADVDMSVFQANFSEFWTKRRASAMQYDPLND